MRGKLIEDVKYIRAIAPAVRTDTATLYNGSNPASITGNGIDTRDYDQINFVVDAGIFDASCTVDLAVYENDSNTPVGSTLVSGNASPSDTASTGATFTQIDTDNDNQIHVASINCKATERYLWVRSVQTAYSSYYGVLGVLGKGDVDPYANAPVFDLNY